MRRGGDGEARVRRMANGHDPVLAVVQQHAAGLLRLARRYSLCADDAHDAYQRALEIFIRRADSLEPEGMVSWLRTVVKHEALAVRESRQRLLGTEEVDLDRHQAPRLPTPDETIERFDLMTRAAEALAQLKEQEARALVLKAQGHSYAEICAITGWTYTKVNRCLTEGRKAFLERCADIESGRECERWAPVLSAMADGEAPARQVVRARAHLRHCPSCRAAVRGYVAATTRVAAVVPLAALAAPDGVSDAGSHVLLRVYEAVAGGVHERAMASAQKVQAALDLAASGKVAAVAASAAALAGGGVVAVGGAVDRPFKPHGQTAQQAADAAEPDKATTDPAAASEPAPAVVTTPAPEVAPSTTTSEAPAVQPEPDPAQAPAQEFGPEQATAPAAAPTQATTTTASSPTSRRPTSTPPTSARSQTAPAPASGGGGGEFGP